jgi:hypothetical protein
VQRNNFESRVKSLMTDAQSSELHQLFQPFPRRPVEQKWRGDMRAAFFPPIENGNAALEVIQPDIDKRLNEGLSWFQQIRNPLPSGFDYGSRRYQCGNH